MWKTVARTTACLALSATAFIAIARLNANAAARPKTATPETAPAENAHSENAKIVGRNNVILHLVFLPGFGRRSSGEMK